jgi:hypothetical protein
MIFQFCNCLLVMGKYRVTLLIEPNCFFLSSFKCLDIVEVVQWMRIYLIAGAVLTGEDRVASCSSSVCTHPRGSHSSHFLDLKELCPGVLWNFLSWCPMSWVFPHHLYMTFLRLHTNILSSPQWDKLSEKVRTAISQPQTGRNKRGRGTWTNWWL